MGDFFRVCFYIRKEDESFVFVCFKEFEGFDHGEKEETKIMCRSMFLHTIR